MGPPSGNRVGSYTVVREIGRGAMATVYEARHAALDKRVALKALHPHLATDARAASRFLREGRAAARIRDPHVVDVFDVGTDAGTPYLVMELLDGVDLAALLRDRGRLPLAELADLMLPIAAAVHAAHEAGVVHRDLKPSNVFLAKRGRDEVRPTVLDFGISKYTGDVEGDLTASEVLLGTVHYMSPEQTRGSRNASAASDQYALGVMLHECATGAKPFAGSTPYALMHAIVSARVAPPSAIDPTLPEAFDEVVLRAMHRDPRKRFASVRDLGAALAPWASETARERYGALLGVAARMDRPVRARRKTARIVLAGLAGLVLAATAFVVAQNARHAGSKPAQTSAAATAAPPSQSDPPAAPAPSAGADPRGVEQVAAPAPAAPSLRGGRGARAPSAAVPSASAASPQRGTNGALIVE